MLADDAARKRLRRNWWLCGVLPMYRFILFWFRFGGFLSVLTEPAEWKVKDPVTQVRESLQQMRQGIGQWRHKFSVR